MQEKYQEPKIYTLPPTNLIPNSPNPLLHYKNTFSTNGKFNLLDAYDTFISNGWEIQWITQYARTQISHYHPSTAEAMVVVSGPGQIRWGVGDLADVEASTYGTDDENVRENGGILMDVNVGDLFVIPAGIAHKNYDPFTRTGDGKLDLGLADGEGEGPGSGTEGKAKCLTGNARGIQAEDPRAFVENLQSKLRGFVMMGAYPKGEEWSWGDASDKGRVDFEEVWNVKRPALDPYVGENGGLLKYWK